MASHLDNIPVYELIEMSVAAADFNRVQIAFHRLGAPLHIALTGLRNLELILDHEAWIVIDRDLNNIPILAWTDFQSVGRLSLHEPVQCILRTYHIHAPVILDQVIAFMEQELEARLSERQKACEIENVIPIRKE